MSDDSKVTFSAPKGWALASGGWNSPCASHYAAIGELTERNAELKSALDTAWEEIGALQTVCRDAGLLLYNVPRVDEADWVQRVNLVLELIDRVVPGGIP